MDFMFLFIVGVLAGWLSWFLGRFFLLRKFRHWLDDYTYKGFEDSTLSFHLKHLIGKEREKTL